MPPWVMLTCGDELDVDIEHTAMVALQIVEMSQTTPVMLTPPQGHFESLVVGAHNTHKLLTTPTNSPGSHNSLRLQG